MGEYARVEKETGKTLPTVRIEQEGTTTRVWLDGEELTGCTAAAVEFRVGHVPLVKLEIASLDVKIKTEDANIAVWAQRVAKFQAKRRYVLAKRKATGEQRDENDSESFEGCARARGD